MKDWKAWLGVAISALLLWWVFRGEDLGDIARQVSEADFWWLATAGAISTAGGLIRAFRWHLLLAPLGVDAPLSARWKALNIGFAVTNIGVGRLGEIARPFALSRMVPVSTSAGLGTVVLERVLDMVALLLILAFVMLAPTFPSGAEVLGQPIGWVAATAVGVGLLAITLVAGLYLRPAAMLRMVRRCAARFPWLERVRAADQVEAFVDGLRLLGSPRQLTLALGWSIGLWLWMASSFLAAFHAFGIELGITAAIFTQCVVSVFVALPAAPGFLGTLQTGVLVALSGVFGLVEADALSMAVGYHLAGYVPVTALGLYYAWTLRIRIGAIDGEAVASGAGRSSPLDSRTPP